MAFFPVVLYILAWILSITMYATDQGYLAMELVRYMLFLSVGFQGVYSFFKNYHYADKTANKIGWKGGPFQAMTAIASLSFGVLGILCFWFPGLWIATALGVSIFYLGSAYLRLQEMVSKKNAAAPGPVFYLDIVVPLTLWLAMLFFYA